MFLINEGSNRECCHGNKIFYDLIIIVPQLSKCLKFEAVRGIKLIKEFEFEQTKKQDPCVYCSLQNDLS